MGGSATAPTPSTLSSVQPQLVFDLAAERGFAYTDAEQQQFIALKDHHLADGLGQGIMGLVMQGVQFLQAFARGLTSGKSMGDAFSEASATASAYTQVAGLEDRLARLHVAMVHAGGNLAATAGMVTGVYDVNADRTVTVPGGDDPRNLLNQATAARNLPTAPFPNNHSLNINPAYQPEHVTVVTPPLATPPGTSAARAPRLPA